MNREQRRRHRHASDAQSLALLPDEDVIAALGDLEPGVVAAFVDRFDAVVPDPIADIVAWLDARAMLALLQRAERGRWLKFLQDLRCPARSLSVPAADRALTAIRRKPQPSKYLNWLVTPISRTTTLLTCQHLPATTRHFAELQHLSSEVTSFDVALKTWGPATVNLTMCLPEKHPGRPARLAYLLADGRAVPASWPVDDVELVAARDALIEALDRTFKAMIDDLEAGDEPGPEQNDAMDDLGVSALEVGWDGDIGGADEMAADEVEGGVVREGEVAGHKTAGTIAAPAGTVSADVTDDADERGNADVPRSLATHMSTLPFERTVGRPSDAMIEAAGLRLVLGAVDPDSARAIAGSTRGQAAEGGSEALDAEADLWDTLARVGELGNLMKGLAATAGNRPSHPMIPGIADVEAEAWATAMASPDGPTLLAAFHSVIQARSSGATAEFVPAVAALATHPAASTLPATITAAMTGSLTLTTERGVGPVIAVVLDYLNDGSNSGPDAALDATGTAPGAAPVQDSGPEEAAVHVEQPITTADGLPQDIPASNGDPVRPADVAADVSAHTVAAATDPVAPAAEELATETTASQNTEPAETITSAEVSPSAIKATPAELPPPAMALVVTAMPPPASEAPQPRTPTTVLAPARTPVPLVVSPVTKRAAAGERDQLANMAANDAADEDAAEDNAGLLVLNGDEHTVDTARRALIRAGVWSAVSELDRRCGNQTATWEAAAIAEQLRSPYSPLVEEFGALAINLDPRTARDAYAQIVGIAASVRVAYIAPAAGAGFAASAIASIRSDLPGLLALAAAAQRADEMALSYATESVGVASSAGQWDLTMDSIGADASEILNRNGRTTFARGSWMWESWVSANGELGQMLRPVTARNLGSADEVRRIHRQLSSDKGVRELITSGDAEHRRASNRAQIDGNSRRTLQRWINEAVVVAGRWLRAADANPARTNPDADRRAEQLRTAFLEAWPRADAELAALAGGDDADLATAATAARTLLAPTVDLVKVAQPLLGVEPPLAVAVRGACCVLFAAWTRT